MNKIDYFKFLLKMYDQEINLPSYLCYNHLNGCLLMDNGPLHLRVNNSENLCVVVSKGGDKTCFQIAIISKKCKELYFHMEDDKINLMTFTNTNILLEELDKESYFLLSLNNDVPFTWEELFDLYSIFKSQKYHELIQIIYDRSDYDIWRFHEQNS